MSGATTNESDAELIARLRGEVEALNQKTIALDKELTDARQSLDRLRAAYTKALEELLLHKQRLYVAKAERSNVAQEQLAFDAIQQTVQSLAEQLRDAEDDESEDDSKSNEGNGDGGKNKRKKPSGRRDLSKSEHLPLEHIELRDAELDASADFVAYETNWLLGYRRGGAVRIRIDRAIYKTADAGETLDEPATFETTPMPRAIIRRGFLAPSMVAHVLAQKFMMGVPFYRQEQQFTQLGCALDRGTMSRYAEEVGATLGSIVVAMSEDAKKTAFCLSTDATGVSIQLGELKDRERGPCRKGHFFIVLADREHVFFEYQKKHTSAAVCEMLRGYSGYLQADAHVIYDALFLGGASKDDPPPKEVGCWSHARRKFWEAAVCKHALGVEGLQRIDALFAVERKFAELAPAQRKQQRDAALRPLIDAFVQWCEQQQSSSRERGLVSAALGYTLRHQAALRRFLDDGRLVMTNNGAERGLRSIAIGRKNWLFCGSDDHANATANLFSLVASCRLHGLDAELYLSEMIHVVPHWPRDRMLELCPRDWARTRARLVADELQREVGAITVPPAEEKS